MKQMGHSLEGVRAGDIEGLGRVYSREGDLMLSPDESILRVGVNWDTDIVTPWRRVLPKILFEGFGGEVSSRLFVTTRRVVEIRRIDPWREVKGEVTPLGAPNAIAKKSRLDELRAHGAHQFCELTPENLSVVRLREFESPRALISIRLVNHVGTRFGVTMWKTDGPDSETLHVVAAQFRRASVHRLA